MVETCWLSTVNQPKSDFQYSETTRKMQANFVVRKFGSELPCRNHVDLGSEKQSCLSSPLLRRVGVTCRLELAAVFFYIFNQSF